MKSMRYILYGLLCTLICVSCADPNREAELQLDDLYKEHGVKGCFLLKSLNSGQTYVYNKNRCERDFLPASTFKIPNSIIALETGVAIDENLLIKWDSIERQIPSWNQDHTMATAFRASCVPYYREIARRIGVSRMQEWVHKLNYGKMDVRPETLTSFWLKGASAITPYQELNFLERLITHDLPIKLSTVIKLKDIMELAKDEMMKMGGKTGWAIDGNRNIGWFVGFIERTDGERFIFVNNIECKVGTISDDDFMMSRKNITGKILKDLGVI